MEWDIPLALGVILAFADTMVAFIVGMHYGPHRAKRLTIDAFKQHDTADEIRRALNLASSTDLAQYMSDLKALQTGNSQVEEIKKLLTDAGKETWKAELSQTIGDLRRQADRLQEKLSNPPALTISSEVEDRIVRSMRSTVSRVLEEQMARLSAVPVGGVPGGGPAQFPGGSPEALAAILEAQARAQALYGVMIERGVSPSIAQAAMPYGEAGLRALAHRLGVDLS